MSDGRAAGAPRSALEAQGEGLWEPLEGSGHCQFAFQVHCRPQPALVATAVVRLWGGRVRVPSLCSSASPGPPERQGC